MRAHPRTAGAAGAKLELAHIVARHGAAFRATHRLSVAQRRALRAIESCRSAALGGHLLECEQCHAQQLTATTPAATAIAPSARRWPKSAGWPHGAPSSCRCAI